ncbi:UbiA family prenyltransferase [Halorubrum sp. N11]|uniref:UbiA family prenyltransferase n=1 Tax=Halorubrum sp. N11 TaxID=3402276 RepID=UPI003EC03356
MVDTTDTSSELPDDTDMTYRSEPLAPKTPPDASAPANGTKSGGRRLAAAFAWGSPFTALVAAVETLIATALLGVQLTVAPAVVALVTFAVYTVDHVADADADAASTPDRALLARRYGDQLMIAATLAYGLAVALAVTGGPLALALALLPGAFWLAYASDWLPELGRAVGGALSSLAPAGPIAGRAGTGVTDGGHSRIPRLKDVLVVNSVVVAAGWATALTFLPITFAGTAVGPAVAAVFAYFFLRSFVDAELPNVRDVDADAAVGVATLPVVLGVVRTRRVLYGVDLLAASAVTAAAAAGLLAWPLVAALGLGIAASICVTALAGRINDESVLGVAPDCTYLVVGAAIAGVSLIG